MTVLDEKAVEAAREAAWRQREDRNIDFDAAIAAAVRAYLDAGLHGPYGWLNGHRMLSEDSWTLESEPLENNEEYFAIPLYALVDPFKEIGKDFDGQPSPSPSQVERLAPDRGWIPLTHSGDRMTCPLPADETVVEAMLEDGTICPAWYSCNIMEAGDWDFLPVKDDGEPDDEADSIASKVVAWRAALASLAPRGDGNVLRQKIEEIRARVERTICPTFSSDSGDIGEQGRISREDFDTLILSALGRAS